MLMHQINSVVEIEQKTEETFPLKGVFYYCYNLLELKMKTYQLSLHSLSYMCILNWKHILKVMMLLEMTAICCVDFP